MTEKPGTGGARERPYLKVVPEVVPFPVSPQSMADAPAECLRSLADDIESGLYGDVSCVALAIFGHNLAVFGFGEDGDAGNVSLLFDAAKLRLARYIEAGDCHEVGPDWSA